MTDIALKEYFERRLDDFDRRVQDRFLASESAVSKAEHTMNERLNSMNEFRDALRDQANRMATRLEVEKLEEQVAELRRAKSNLDGRLVILSGLISLMVTIGLWGLTHILK